MKRVLGVLLTVLLLCAGALAEGVPCALYENERYNVNLFLSNFTEQAMTHYDAAAATDRELADFAVWHIWFNQRNRWESGEWGVYNRRLAADDAIRASAKKYLGKAPQNLAAGSLDLIDGYYCFQETGGYFGLGFACASQVEDWGGGRYHVYFGVYGGGEFWTNADCALRPEQAAARYAGTGVYPGEAVIRAKNGLGDRAGFTLERLEIEP